MVIGIAAMPEAPLAVLVLGPHRSGTSCVTELVHGLGFELGRDVLGARPGNPRGLWENAGVVAASETLLARAASAWYDPGFLALDDLLDPAVIQEGLAAAVAEQFACSPIVIKDPRLCRLAGPCAAALRRRGYRVRFVLVLRDPRDSAESLYRRDGIPRQLGMVLWLSHMLAALRATRGENVRVVDYDALLEGEDQLAELAAWLRDDMTPAVVDLTDLRACIAPDLRHASKMRDALAVHPLNKLVTTVFDHLRGASHPVVGEGVLAVWESRFRAAVKGPRWLAAATVVVMHQRAGEHAQIQICGLDQHSAGLLLIADGHEEQATLFSDTAAKAASGNLGLFWNLGVREEAASLARGALLAGSRSILLTRFAARGIVDRLVTRCAKSSAPIEFMCADRGELALWIPARYTGKLDWHYVELGEAAWYELARDTGAERRWLDWQ